MIFRRTVGRPHRRAVASLEPNAKTWRPNTVFFNTTAVTVANPMATHTPGGSA